MPARPTPRQKLVMEQLERDYGPPSVVKIENRWNAIGIVWMQWTSTLNVTRNLFIKPDGTRLSWGLIEAE